MSARHREHSRVPVTADYNVSDLQVSAADPGWFDSAKYLRYEFNICMLRLKALWNLNQFNRWGKCRAAGCFVKAFWSWNQKIRSHCVVRTPTRWDQSRKSVGFGSTFQGHLVKVLKSFAGIANRPSKNERCSYLDSKPWSSVIQQRHLLCPLWLLSFSLMLGGETILHMKDESRQSSLSFFCVLPKALG